jgi:glycosyltransferase involved in cell wall biosynthesis
MTGIVMAAGMGARARELALEDFDFEVGAERLLDIYSGGSG